MTISPYGDSAVFVAFKDEVSLDIHQLVMQLVNYLEKLNSTKIIEWIPSYHAVTILYNPLISSYQEVITLLSDFKLKISTQQTIEKNIVQIPVCYDTSLGLDIETLTKNKNLTIDKIINLHTKNEYLVYMLGFTPGFMYLGGLNEKLHFPRKATPRLKIPAGAVGIAGSQTGIYPIESPGGWQIIGQTPIPIFNTKKTNPFLVKAGDYVKFSPISLEEYHIIKQHYD